MNFLCKKIRLFIFKNKEMNLGNIPKVLFSSVLLSKKMATKILHFDSAFL